MIKTVFITGVSGTVGREALLQIARTKKFRCRILLRPKKANAALAKKLQKRYGVEVLFGDLHNYDDCLCAVKDIDYLIHCAALIPPHTDHNPDEALHTNCGGTENLLRSLMECGQTLRTKFVYIGSVAEYGGRTFKHPWGRIGDPLMPSAFDMYAASKIRAERAVIESPLCWTVLRVSAVLYDKLFFNNMHDGLMFHTCWNAPIEWTTIKTSGLLLKNLIEKDANATLKSGFWKKIYNVGNGKDSRVTGYETFERGFQAAGCNIEKIFQPEWNVLRNSHCLWFADSYILNDYLDFQHEGFEDFFTHFEKRFRFLKLAKPFTFLIKRFILMPLLRTVNAPFFWISHHSEKRIRAFFGSASSYNAIARKWDNFFLLCKNRNPETGAFLDYNSLKDENNLRERGVLLDHGYDDTKPIEKINIQDVKKAANFRGGLCLSFSMKKGDVYGPLHWKCHNGHEFKASAYLILKAGHWCPECCSVPPWNFGELAKHIPFYAQIRYDDHNKEETDVYTAEDCRDLQKYRFSTKTG